MTFLYSAGTIIWPYLEKHLYESIIVFNVAVPLHKILCVSTPCSFLLPSRRGKKSEVTSEPDDSIRMETVTSKAWNHKQADKIYFSPFFTIPSEKGRSTWLCSGYLGMCPLSTAFINYEKNAQHIPFLFIDQELLTVQNHWLALREIKHWSVWLARSLFQKINLCNHSSGPYQSVSEDC